MSGSSTQQELSETNVLDQLIDNNGDNPLMQKVLDMMAAKLDEARLQYFRKPTATVPYGASIEHSQIIAKRHPELREITYQVTEASPSAIFDVTKHLAVRRTLLQLVASDSGLVEDPFAQQILTSGINMSHHMFVWRTSIPLCNLDAEPIIQATKFYMVVDVCESKISIAQIFERMSDAYAAEALITAPYDPRMWTVMGGHNAEADYVFQWMDPRALPDKDIIKPANLPSRFFSDKKYRAWSLYIQPAGSVCATAFKRDEFIQLYGGVNLRAFHEMRMMRNGFADISIINAYNLTDYTPTSLPEALARVMSSQSVSMGMVEIPRFSDCDMSGMLRLGRQYDLHCVYPCVVRQSLADNAQRKFFTTRPGRDLIASLLQTLHATSARFVYNGAIITIDQLVDVETLCVLLEYVIRSNISSKLKLTAVTGLARTPHSARSSDYAMAIVNWASNKVIERADITKGPKEVASYVASLLNKGTPDPFREVQADEGLQFGEPQSPSDFENDDLLASIVEYAQDSLGDPFDLPYKVQREELDVDKLDVMAIRQAMMKMDVPAVSIYTVQDVYDHIEAFAGNSVIFPTMNQVEMEKSDFKFTIDVQYFRASIPALFSCTPETKAIPSMLRTSVGTDLSTSSFRQLLLSLMKRNFNRPRPEAPGSRLKSVIEKVATAISTYGHARAKPLMAWYCYNPVTVSGDVLQMWASQHTRSEVLAAATMLSQEELMPDQYRVMTKDVPKPVMDLSAQGELAVGQTIVFHGKDVIALTAGAFNLYLTRVISLFDTNIRFAFGPDEHTSGDWADSYLDLPNTVVTEIDVPKFDKSQDWMCFELILHVMERVGMDSSLVKLWRKASDGATVFNALFNLTFTTMFGNRSGNAGTLGTNCIVLLFAYLSTFSSAGIVAILIKGDDSVLVTKRSLSHEEHVVRLLQDWGFSMKIRERKGNVTSFCSSFFVKDSNDKYRLVRDPCRVITKLGRALSLTKPASYFLDYYVAVFDTAVSYDDDIVVHNLTNAVCIFYGCEIDVVTFVNFLKYVSVSSERFLSVVYGLTPDQITNINDFDDAEEALIRTKSSKFTKAKHLADKHSVVKTSLQTQIRLSCDWIFD